MKNDFKGLGIGEELIKGLNEQGIVAPMPIQSKVIPILFSGKDVVARSETGSGKTLAYLIPIFMRVDLTIKGTQAIILTPTHELASQVNKQAELLAKNSGINIKTALVIGGANVSRQIDRLKEKPQVIIGSPGRILELIKKKKIPAHTVKTIVIDEADRMFDLQNVDGVKAVIKTTLRDRQLALFSASMPNIGETKAKDVLKDPVIINDKEHLVLPKNIEHLYIACERREKIIILRRIIHAENVKRAIVFINNPENIGVITEKLNFHKIPTGAIHGKVFGNKRREALEDFRTGRINVLVSSDIGARGLDIEGVSHVINLDMPENPNYYLHRSGRTGRMGEHGKVISIVTLGEEKWINKHGKLLSILFTKTNLSHGNLKKIGENSKK